MIYAGVVDLPLEPDPIIELAQGHALGGYFCSRVVVRKISLHPLETLKEGAKEQGSGQEYCKHTKYRLFSLHD